MTKLRQGTLDHIEAIERLAPNGGLAEKKDAWRRLCQAIMRRHILPIILNESSTESYAADPDQFWGLQERYIHVASNITGRLQHLNKKHDLTVENPDPLSEWRDKDGITHLRGRLCIPEGDLWKAEKSPPSRRGAPPKYDWEAIRTEAFRLLDENDDFSLDKPHWTVQARLVEELLKFCFNTFGEEPAHSMLREKILGWLAEWRKQKRAVEN